jgi:hypothetical protein
MKEPLLDVSGVGTEQALSVSLKLLGRGLL